MVKFKPGNCYTNTSYAFSDAHNDGNLLIWTDSNARDTCGFVNKQHVWLCVDANHKEGWVKILAPKTIGFLFIESISKDTKEIFNDL